LVKTRDDSDFTTFIDADELTFQYTIGGLEQQIILIFNTYRQTHEFANSVYMGRENGTFVRSHKRNRPTKYDPRVRPWYALAKENPGKVVRTDPYTSLTSTDVNVGVVTALVDETNQVYGVVGIDITLANLTHYIENVQSGQNGYMVLLDKNGTFLASRNRRLRFQTIDAIFKDNVEPIYEEQKGLITLTHKTEKDYLFFRTSPELGWKIGMIIPVRDVNREVRESVTQVILVLVFALLLLSALTMLGLRRFVVKPLRELNEATDLIKRTSNYHHQIEIQSNDEIGQLTQSFNDMMLSIHAADTALKQSEKELKAHRDHLEELVEQRTAELRENQEQLERAEERSRLLLESAGEGIFGVGKDGLVNFINPAELTMLGFELEEVIGQQIHPLIHHIPGPMARLTPSRSVPCTTPWSRELRASETTKSFGGKTAPFSLWNTTVFPYVRTV
jgi:PAS domain-containing protein